MTKEPICAVCDRAFSDHVSVISHDFVHQKIEAPSSKTESLADRFKAKFLQAHSQSRPLIISWELAVEIRDALSGGSPAPDTGMAGQIEAARARIAGWPADVRAAMGLPSETTARQLAGSAALQSGPVNQCPVGWLVGKWDEYPAMFNLQEREKAFDAAKRWGRPITPVVLGAEEPTPELYTQEALDAAHQRTRERLATLKVDTDLSEKATAPAWDCACNELDCPYCANRNALNG